MDRVEPPDSRLALAEEQETLLGMTRAGDISGDDITSALAKIQRYLGEFVETCEAERLSPVVTDLPIHHYGVFPGLTQKGYRLFSRVAETPVAVTLAFHLCHPRSHVMLFKRGGFALRSLESLRDDGLKILNSRILGLDSSTQRVRFEVVGDIPVRFEFAANYLDGYLDLWISNFESLGTVQYALAADKVDADLLHDLKDYLLRRSTAFLDRVVGLGKRISLKDRMVEERVDPVSVGNSGSNVISFYDHRQRSRKELQLKFRGKQYRFSSRAGSFLIGRGSHADLRVGVLSVSREHLLLTYKDGQFYIQDISSNGTFYQQDGKPEFLVHQATRPLNGHGTLSLSESVQNDGRAVIRYSIS